MDSMVGNATGPEARKSLTEHAPHANHAEPAVIVPSDAELNHGLPLRRADLRMCRRMN
jgi:hypothetical protein